MSYHIYEYGCVLLIQQTPVTGEKKQNQNKKKIYYSTKATQLLIVARDKTQFLC